MDPNDDRAPLLRQRPQTARGRRTPVAGSFDTDSSLRPVLEQDPRSTTNSAFIPEQFRPHKKQSDECVWSQMPVKSVLLGLFLFLCGLWAWVTVFLNFFTESDTKQTPSEQDDSGQKSTSPDRGDNFWPLLFLGFLAIVPGAYVLSVTVFVLLGIPGYSFDDIP